MDFMGWSSASRIAAATLSLVLVGACGAGSGDSGDTGQSQAPSPTVSEPPPSPTPTPLSIKDYSNRLTKAVDPLAAALDELATARGYKGLERRVTGIESAAAKAATELDQLNPPTGLDGTHAQLVTALQSFAGDTGRIGTKVDGRSLCTGAVVRAGLGNVDATASLRKAVASMYAKLPGDQRVLKLPSADQKGDPRPSTGTYIRDVNRNARAELEVKNGGSSDAVVTLTKGDKPDISVYVRKGKTYTVRGVPDGTYAVYFKNGSGWDDAARAFGRNCRFQKFADPMRFRTTRDTRGVYWQNFTITLNPVLGGNAQTDEVDPDDFPDS